MEANYYHNVTIADPVEKSLSIGRMLDSWGSKLIAPYQQEYGGHSYTIHLFSQEIIQHDNITVKTDKLSLLNKAIVKIGLMLKKAGAFFDAEVKAKYLLVGAAQQDKAALFDKLHQVRKATVHKKEGSDDDLLLGCCLGIFLALLSTPRRHHYSYRYHHGGYYHYHNHCHRRYYW